MNIRKVSYSLALVAMFAFAGTVSAQGTATAPELIVEAEVESALRLDISSHGSGVVGTGTTMDFVVDLGLINALGMGTPATGVTSRTVVGIGAAGYSVYTTPIVLTPVYSGFGAGTATITLAVGGGTNDATAFEGDSNLLAAVAGARSVVTGAASDSANVRHVGFKVDKTEAIGVRDAIFVYTVTVQ